MRDQQTLLDFDSERKEHVVATCVATFKSEAWQKFKAMKLAKKKPLLEAAE